MEFSVESFQRHQEKLVAMQLRQQQQLRQQEIDMDAASNRSDVTPAASSSGSEVSLLRYTLDSERAEFAVSALHDASKAHRGLQAAGPGSRRLLEANCPPSLVNSLSSVKSLLLASSSSGNLSSSDRSRSTGIRDYFVLFSSVFSRCSSLIHAPR